jgi:hypothetical protein
VALSEIDVNRYVIFSTSADYNRVYNLTGDVWSRNYNYQLSAYNKLWRRYVQLGNQYGRSAQSHGYRHRVVVRDLVANAVSTYLGTQK